MTRKDYIRIAEALRHARGHAKASLPDQIATTLTGVVVATEYIANAMQDDNPRFNRQHFIAVVRGEKDSL